MKGIKTEAAISGPKRGDLVVEQRKLRKKKNKTKARSRAKGRKR